MSCNTGGPISGIHNPPGFPVVTGPITIIVLLPMRHNIIIIYVLAGTM